MTVKFEKNLLAFFQVDLERKEMSAPAAATNNKRDLISSIRLYVDKIVSDASIGGKKEKMSIDVIF